MNIWITKDHKEIPVKDMTTEHIKNTIKCIEDGRISFLINLGWETDNDFQIIDENIEEKEKWLKIFKRELKKRKVGDIE